MALRGGERKVAAPRALCYNSAVDVERLPRWAVREEDRRWMAEALAEAEKALAHGDVPVGAVAVWDGRIVGRGHNRREVDRDPTAHAEMIALREAARTLGGWRLRGVTLYCTLEPCPMCAGAMVQAQIDRLVYGADDPKAGAAGSVVELLREPWLHHRPAVTRGVLAEEARALLNRFFADLRAR
ncbi:MAG TPA: nucleoside deaminase [Chloroflexi bacterium]|nr:nucleoside deaminase [Chloroflexota bacterium]